MNSRVVATFGLSALLLGGTMVGCTHGQGLASASSRNADKTTAQAADLAARAGKALARKNGDKAVEYAEAAVALKPREASYRALLGQSYLEAGRFASAHQAFVDTLTLDPHDARAALNLALAQTAEGDWASARKTLSDHADVIPVSDLGLALALAGDPKDAVATLLPAARSPSADAKTRQNLALAFALAGDWRDARVVVGMDLSPAQVDQRLGQWAALAQPHSASDQVAALLGVKASQDPGQPVALALNAPSTPVALADAPVAAPVAPTTPVETTKAVAVADAAPAIVAPVTEARRSQAAQVVFAQRREVVQPLPAAPVPAPRAVPAHLPMLAKATQPAAVRAPASGDYYVQIGAYENAAVAHDGWTRAARRFPAFAAQTPQGMPFSQGNTTYYRLSVGGFSKADARHLCTQYRTHGGHCFIRTGAGDQVAQWVSKGTELASR